MTLTRSMQDFLLRHKGKADNLLFLLSCLALALFASNEIVAVKADALVLNASQWATVQILSRFTIWIFFVIHFAAYGMLSGNPWQYARSHLVELLVCIAWFPHHDVSILRDLTNILSIGTVQLLGTLANGLLVVRHIVRTMRTHPVIVTSSVFLLVIFTASEMLMQVEPQTFPSLFDALWYSVVTTTTVGYGDLVPQTFAGRCIGMGLMLSGISLAAACIGIVSQSVQNRIGQVQNKEAQLLAEKLSEEQEKNKRLINALEKDNQLKEQLLRLLEKQSEKS